MVRIGAINRDSFRKIWLASTAFGTALTIGIGLILHIAGLHAKYFEIYGIRTGWLAGQSL